jgi:imidazolonepropionase-like amidohydrolase
MKIVRISVMAGLALVLMGTAFTPAQVKPGRPGQNEGSVIALTGGLLIDGNGGAPIPAAVVLIQGRKILQAGPAATVRIPENAERIDIRGKTVLPGFIDCHIHTTWPFEALQSFTDTEASTTLRALYLMNLYLRSGVTSVRDVGSNVPAMQGLTGAQAAGYIDSIRLFACGALITTTGGHGHGMLGASIADGPWAWRKAVRENAKAGFGLIKISPPFTLEEASAAVEEAKTLGLRITAHGGGVSDTNPPTMTRIAVEAGVQCVEHLPDMEDDVLDLMARRGVFSVPTLSVYRDQYKGGKIPPVLLKRNWSRAMHETLFRKARERKILMGVGTDYVIDMKRYPAIYFDEMKSYVELGVSPLETIVMATRNGAIILGRADELGTIEAGKLADLQVVNGDPLRSFDVLGRPEIVFVDGTMHRY